jgi:NADPH-dependent 2,4-dienoyl-CoA reductase/sulfur reductase-like enzyme
MHVPGSTLDNIFTLRTLEEANSIAKLAEELDEEMKVVVVGTGFIGMELAALFAENVASLVVIGSSSVPLSKVLGKRVGQAVQALHESKGVEFVFEPIDRFEPLEEDEAVVGSVVLRDGTVIEADLVIFGIGVDPATAFLKDTFTLEADKSIKVDSTMRVLDRDNIYAIGDIATYNYHLTQEWVRIEHWAMAQNMARVAVKSIMKREEPLRAVPFFWTVCLVQGVMGVESAGQEYPVLRTWQGPQPYHLPW